jgi:tRNA U34 5-methylaminomethyl-2-thiouridine-forming methyltransferase MnmC
MSKKQFLITEDGSHTIFLSDLNETYHSMHGAIQESQYVFIERGLDFSAKSGKQSIRIFEVGFGTGLNALLSWIYGEKQGIKIQYQTIEAHPLDQHEISQLNYAGQIQDPTATEKFQKIHQATWGSWQELSPGFQIKKERGFIQDYSSDELVDICFFDAFAPSKQPEMWDISVLANIKKMLVQNGVFVTYCAKGQLKRDLKGLGFEVETLPGPPGKFEMVRAVRTSY